MPIYFSYTASKNKGRSGTYEGAEDLFADMTFNIFFSKRGPFYFKKGLECS